jgi:hypothetical protein
VEDGPPLPSPPLLLLAPRGSNSKLTALLSGDRRSLGAAIPPRSDLPAPVWECGLSAFQLIVVGLE